MIEMQRTGRQGDSGGPILNSRGELAGVLFGTAFGRTTGSYCGRLRWFLGSVDGDFQRVSSQALLARQGSRPSASVAAISSSPRPPVGEVQGVRASYPVAYSPGEQPAKTISVQPAAQLPGYFARRLPQVQASQAPLSAIPSPPAVPMPTTDQIRSILALIGAVAVLYSALRFLGWAIG